MKRVSDSTNSVRRMQIRTLGALAKTKKVRNENKLYFEATLVVKALL